MTQYTRYKAIFAPASRAERRLLALAAIYTFASHEAAGIRAAWLTTT